MTPTLGQVLGEMGKILNPRPSGEAEILLSEAWNELNPSQKISRSDLKLRLRDPASPEVMSLAYLWADRRARGEPIQYVVGRQAFLDHDYRVGPGVLVPRPETESWLVRWIESWSNEGFVPSTGIEVGLGSGVVSIELLSRFPHLRMFASERSEPALAYARENASRILGEDGAARLVFLRPGSSGDVFEPFSTPHTPAVDLIVSNPPYLCESDEIDAEVLLHEPREALFPELAPPDPLYFYKKIARGARALLSSRGRVAVEVPHERANEVKQIFSAEFASVDLIEDLTGRPRAVFAKGCVAHG